MAENSSPQDNLRYGLSLFGLDPGAGYDTAAAGARAAQADANALSNLQWQRQMAGLQQAQGYTNQLQSLYNSLYSPGGDTPAAGGLGSMGLFSGGQGSADASQMLVGPPTQPAGREPGQVEKDLARYTPGASFGYLRDGNYSAAARSAVPTVSAIGDLTGWW
jgi:hypothetical protein